MRRLIANDPQQEARAQGVLLDRLETSFAERVEAELISAMTRLVGEFGATGSTPFHSIDHMRRMQQLYLDLAVISIDAFGGRVLDQGKALGLVLETKGFVELFQRLAEEYVQAEEIRQRITGVTETTRNIIIRRIAMG